jgi:hypothetical protein
MVICCKIGNQINVYKIIGVFVHNDTTTNQLHIDGFMFEAKNIYMWSLKKFKVSEVLRVITFYAICSPSFLKIIYIVVYFHPLLNYLWSGNKFVGVTTKEKY